MALMLCLECMALCPALFHVFHPNLLALPLPKNAENLFSGLHDLVWDGRDPLCGSPWQARRGGTL